MCHLTARMHPLPSPQDTIVALQALTEYAFRARLRDITDMRVNIESSGLRSDQKLVTIGNITARQVRTVTVSTAHIVWAMRAWGRQM